MSAEGVAPPAGSAREVEAEREAPSRRQPPEELLAMCEQAEALLAGLNRAFAHYDRAALAGAERLAAQVHAAERTLTEALLRTPWAFVPGHLERIGDEAETILRCIRIILTDGVPFSDRAVGEVDELMRRAAEMLRLVRDAILTRNRFLLDALEREGTALADRAASCAEAHEARLIEGLCSPRASSLFLAMLDALRGIQWHARQIGRRLRGTRPGDQGTG